ncbi:MAG TPA: alpha-L-fucosidase [Bryobacteraceae bacterium]|nr:alpha-L-fucosidase [Bryobacteraceae bacterium]
MAHDKISRRDYMALAAAGAALAGARPSPAAPADAAETRERRMKWWHEARFGMFIHWGLYSVAGRHEWIMENEAIPVAEYEQLAKRFTPKPNAARAWAKLARQAGQKYMVMTTKHHEGFCNFDSKLTNYTAAKQACGRDLVKEYVDAARAEGLRVGFYYSLMDWHHPDGARCADDEAARRRFVDYIHGHVRELCTNYGKLDVLWYDVSWPLKPEGWESAKMNAMVRELQPDIIINNRSGLPEDFATPEQNVNAADRAWEACMTMNGSWGYQKADDDWKSPRTVLKYLITCARDGGNYLLNIGPKPDGSIPEDSIRILTAIGKWMEKNGDTIYTAEPCKVKRSNYALFTRKGNTLYMHVHYWPGDYVAISGLKAQVKSARLHASGKVVKVDQDRFRTRISGLPAAAPDDPITTIALECDTEPIQDTNMVRKERPRRGVGIA